MDTRTCDNEGPLVTSADVGLARAGDLTPAGDLACAGIHSSPVGREVRLGLVRPKIERVAEGKRRYLDLLLLADEQEDMVERYLDAGDMYLASVDGEVVGECVVTDEGDGLLELKNIAVHPPWQGRGIGRFLIESMVERHRGTHGAMQVGTGDVPSTVGFYEQCGFVRSHRVPAFFTDNYDHPIIEDGIQLIDMVYLRRLF